MLFNYKYFTIKGNSKNINSDYVLISNLSEGWIGVVCDGIGENQNETNTAKLCAEELIKSVKQTSESDPIKKLKYAIEQTNKYIYSLWQNKNAASLTTTLAVLYLFNHNAYWGHVGDSRIYKLKNGRLQRLTRDHSIIQQLIDRGFLTIKEAAFHSGANVVGKAIGEKSNIKADISKISLYPNDKNRFILCTDGVTEVINDKEIQECLENKSIDESVANLVSLLEKNESSDDSSFIIVDVS